MSSNIKIGDRVVCVKAHSESDCPVKVGREYIVYGIDICKCGDVSFDVGILNPTYICGTRCSCGEVKYGDTWWLGFDLFRKVEEKTNYVKLEVKVQEPCLN